MAKRRPQLGASKIRAAIRCVHCGADVGEPCWDKRGVTMQGVHWQRRADLERAKGKRPPRGAPVTVSYVCPICGGPHARASHV